MVSVIDVPVVNGADPVPPTATLIPAGLEVTRSPLRPVAVTVSVAVFVAPPFTPVIVTGVDAPTAVVVTLNVALVAPAATATLAGTPAAVLPLDSVTTAPPAGAALVNVAVPCAAAPPTTLAGLRPIADSAAAAGAAFGWKRRAADHAPAVPAELMPRARHQCRTLANPPIVNCDGVTV